MRTRQRVEAEAALESEEPEFGSVALVVGCTAMVGDALAHMLPLPDAPDGPWKIYALSRRPLPAWWSAPPASSSNPNAFVHLQVDLADTSAVARALAPLTADITHVFYTAWSPCYGWSDAEACVANRAMLLNVLSAVVPTSPKLLHVSLLACRNQLIDPFEPVAEVPNGLGPYSEDLPRPDLGYSDVEDALVDGVACRDGAVTWSVHRATTIFGFSPRSDRNIVASLCIYAAICSKEDAMLRWPGSLVAWEGFSEASDAEILCEQMVWASLGLGPCSVNTAFNCTNGDVFKWKQLWPMLANHFGLEWAGYESEDQRFKLADAMAGKEAVWAVIVRENGLVETELNDVANWSFVDAVINADKEHLGNANKGKDHGFYGFRNTVRSFDRRIRWMKALKIAP